MPCQCGTTATADSDAATGCACATDQDAACECGSAPAPDSSYTDAGLARIVMELDKRVRKLESTRKLETSR